MISSELIANLLNQQLRASKPDSINAELSRYMLAHLDTLPNMRVSDIAQSCFTSSPSVIRFVRQLGFSDYKQFREALLFERSRLARTSPDAIARSLISEDDTYALKVRAWIDQTAASMSRCLASIDLSLVRLLASEILSHQHVICIGAGASTLFGNYLNRRLAYQQKALVSMGVPDKRSGLGFPREETLAIVVSQTGNILRDNEGLLDYLRTHAEATWVVAQVPKGSFNEDIATKVLHLDKEPSIPHDIFGLLACAELVGQWCQELSSQ